MADAADLTGLALTPEERRAADVRAREEVVFAGGLRRAAGRAAGVKAVEGSHPFSVWSGQQPLCLCLFGLTNLVGPGSSPLQN